MIMAEPTVAPRAMEPGINPVPPKLKPSTNGFSIIEILIFSGLMAIMIAAVTQMMTAQNKAYEFAKAKIASVDLERSLQRALADGSVCHFIFTDVTNSSGLNQIPPAAVFTIPVTYPLNEAFTMNKIPFLVGGNSPSVVEIDKPFSSMSNNILVSKIAVDVDLPGPVVGTNQFFNASIVVSFNTPSRLIPLKALRVPITLQAAVSGGNATINGCAAYGPITAEMCTAMGGTYNPTANPVCSLP